MWGKGGLKEDALGQKMVDSYDSTKKPGITWLICLGLQKTMLFCLPYLQAEMARLVT